MELFAADQWFVVRDGDPRAFGLYMRHYSRRYGKQARDPRDRRIAGPGEHLILMTGDCRALFCWKVFIDKSGQKGIYCSVFRNEGACRSSGLILSAELLARVRWPNERRFYTFIDDRRIASQNPGYCFKCAGWGLVRADDGKPLRTKQHKLLIMAKERPNDGRDYEQ